MTRIASASCNACWLRSRRFHCRLHACVLMDNHVHLLMTPDQAGDVLDLLLSPHPCFLALGPDGPARQAAYRGLFDQALPASLVVEIRQYLQQQKVLGPDRFRAWVQTFTGRFATARPPGRPPQRSNCP